jgi:hypothetical protein
MGWRRGFSDSDGGEPAAQISTGSTQYISEKGGNNAPLTYQDASGAPVEHQSPLGYSVNPVTLTLLNITMMIGAGIYSTPSSILGGTGSVGVSFIYWTLGYLVCHDVKKTRICVANIPFRTALSCLWSRLLGVHCILPQSIGFRSRLPRTGLPTP